MNEIPVPQPISHSGNIEKKEREYFIDDNCSTLKNTWVTIPFNLEECSKIDIPITPDFLNVCSLITLAEKVFREPFDEADFLMETITGHFPHWKEIWRFSGPDVRIMVCVYGQFESDKYMFNARCWIRDANLRMDVHERYFLLHCALSATSDINFLKKYTDYKSLQNLIRKTREDY